MARTKDELPRWAKILIAIFIVGALVWALVPEEIIYISIGVAVVIIGGISYLVYRKRGAEPFKISGKKVFKAITASEPMRKPPRTPIPADIKRTVFKRADGSCQHPRCNKLENLKIHHIDRDRTNHKSNNLVLLCPDHHNKADNGNFRVEQLKAWMKHPKRD